MREKRPAMAPFPRTGASPSKSTLFDMISEGKDVVVRDQLDENRKKVFDSIAERMGFNGDRMTREQFDEYAKKHHLPVEATRGGAETALPEFMKKMAAPAPARSQALPISSCASHALAGIRAACPSCQKPSARRQATTATRSRLTRGRMTG